MAGFDNFDDETGINSPPELTGKVILIARQYPTEIVTTPIFNLRKILDFLDYNFQ